MPRLCIHTLANLDVQAGEEMALSYVAVKAGGNLVDLMLDEKGEAGLLELRLREHPDLGAVVENLTSVSVNEPRDIQYHVEVGMIAAEKEDRRGGAGFNLFTISVKRPGGVGDGRVQVRAS